MQTEGAPLRRRLQRESFVPSEWVSALDHDPFNNVPENLAALCQRCHILHDKAEHLRRRRLTYLARRALGDLFTGPYREA